MSSRRSILWVSVIAAIVATATLRAPAADEETEREQQVKAAFVVNMAKFTTWPRSSFESPDAPLRIAVIGSAPKAAIIESLVRDQRIDDRRVLVSNFAPTLLDDEDSMNRSLRAMHVVYLENDGDPRVRNLLNGCAGRPVLTISDTAGFARRGGMIELVRQGERVVFDANLRSINQSGVVVSSKALKLARVVHGREPAP